MIGFRNSTCYLTLGWVCVVFLWHNVIWGKNVQVPCNLMSIKGVVRGLFGRNTAMCFCFCNYLIGSGVPIQFRRGDHL